MVVSAIMNTETNDRPVRKMTITIGFIALLVLIAWLSITIVKNVPGSFASLASLAESVRSYDASQIENASDDEASVNGINDMLIVTSDINVIQTGNSVRLSWTDTTTKGSFVFSYECTEGVDITMIDDEGIRYIECDTNYNLGDVNNTTLSVTSEKQRFVDLSYTIAFLSTKDTEPSVSDTAVLTVVNDRVPVAFSLPEDIGANLAIINEDSETEIVIEDIIVDETVAETEETPLTTPAPVTPVTPGEEFTQEFTYTIPVSDPNGRIDLATRFLDVGTISGNAFVAGKLDNDKTGAIQFEVKNLGTKTSEEWTYSISLPSSGIVNSDDQAPLKPNERAVITIGFPVSDITDYDFKAVIDTEDDNTSRNDQFTENITFSD